MGLSFNNNSIEDLKNQINIVDVIGRVVNLKRAGANYKGICPFHNEKTPSFVVSEQKQIFTCFGCGAAGDAIEFTKRYYNLEFSEAVEKLAGEYGIKIDFNNSNKDKEQYYQLNKEAAMFFYKAFTEKQNPGYSYMKKRGMDDSTLKKFGIGYADESWDSLYRYFNAKGVADNVLLELGLISQSNGKYYDKFRNRVMFPIINTGGKVIGFGGRAIGDDSPKYLNSPENRIFQKKNNLYGLNTTRQDIGKEGYAILVEGYMDAISLYQGGVHNVAASLGTALTENQAKLLNRYTKNIVLSYDSDTAGRNAALRGLDILNKENCKVRVLHVTEGKDPDEFIKKNGRQAFIDLVDNATPMIDYKLDSIKSGLDMSSEEGRIDFLKKAAAVLRQLSPVEADIYIKKVSQDYKIAEGAIRMEIIGNNIGENNPLAPQKKIAETQVRELSNLEATILKVLFLNPTKIEPLVEFEDVFRSELGKKCISALFELYAINEDFDFSQLNDKLDPQESKSLSEALDKILIAGNEEQIFNECLTTWKLGKLKETETMLINKLTLVDDETDENAVEELQKNLIAVQKEINSYGGRK